jgi:hypothetical protein
MADNRITTVDFVIITLICLITGPVVALFSILIHTINGIFTIRRY